MAAAAVGTVLRRHCRCLRPPHFPLSTPISSIVQSFTNSPIYATSVRRFSWVPWTGSPAAGSSEHAGVSEEELNREYLDLGLSLGSELHVNVTSGVEPEVISNEVLDTLSWWDYPTSVVISTLSEFHDLTGLPWWVVISSSTLALRLSLFPVLLFQLKKMAKFAQLIRKLPPPMPPPLSGRSYRQQYLLFREKRRELGCPSYMWNFASFIVQFPCFLLWMTSIRSMCLNHHPGFDCGGTLWFQNLTDYPHGYLAPVFPMLVAGLHFVNVQISFSTFKFESLQGIFGLLARYYKLYLDILAFPLLFIGFHIPQGSLVYWATNSSLTLVQQLCLKNQNVRKQLGLPKEVPRKNPVHATHPPKEMDGSVEIVIPEESLSPQKLLEVALEELARGHQDTAFQLLRSATERDPELVRGLIAMGQILYSRKEFIDATKYFERAISKVQQEEVGLLILSYFGGGLSRISQGDITEGIELLKRISELKEPDDPNDRACYHKGLVLLASYLLQEGKKSEAVKYLTIAATYDPGVNVYLKQCEEDDDPVKQSVKK